jgi:amino acid transporter
MQEQANESTSEGAGQGQSGQLARTMGLGALIIYGVGDMVGAGIYATVGKGAKLMGNALWAGFAAAMLGALLTGLSYASLGSRYPRAAGAAFITQRAFSMPFLSFCVGLAVAASGLTSFATQSRAFVGYALGLADMSPPGTAAATAALKVAPTTLPPPDSSYGLWIAIVLGFIGVLTLVNLAGIKQAAWLNALCTGIELLGLAIVLALGFRFWGSVNLLETPSGSGGLGFPLLLQGAALTFYAFVGFEDMINVSEEVKDPQRNFPRAVMAALAIVTLIYISIAITVVSVVPHQVLGASGQPLVDVVKTASPGFPIVVFSFIALFAIANTGLLNYIMASRLLYGMARMGFVPKVLGTVHPRRKTPTVAIGVLLAVVTMLAFAGDVSKLAGATTILLLSVFMAVNAALFVLQRRPGEAKGAFEIPTFVPALGIIVCGAMLFSNVLDADRRAAFPIALALLAGIGLLYFLAKPKNISEETLSQVEH